MNNQTTELLQQLAQKMGTTVQYLWGILLKQAPIDATITLFQFFIVGILSFLLYKAHRRLLKPIESDDKLSYRYDNGYDKYNASAGVPMIIGAIILVTLIMVCLFSIGDVINGYFNPEYWALNRILKVSQQQ